MNTHKGQRKFNKPQLAEQLHGESRSLRKRYQSRVLASQGWAALLRYEAVMLLSANLGGAPGYVLRKFLFPRLFREVGSGTIFGRGLTVRHPERISIGRRVAIDDYVMLDASGAGQEGVRLDEEVIVARNVVIQGKLAPIKIGRRTDIGANTVISSVSGIRIGREVLIAGNCYIGGGRYRTENLKTPMMDQGHETRGAVEIGDDVWIGAGVTIIDGASIGSGAIVGAGAVVTGRIPDYAIAVGIPARVARMRAESGPE